MHQLIIFISLIGSAQSLPQNQAGLITTSQDNNIQWLWLLLTVLGSIGVIYNSLTISMMYLLVKNKKRFSFFTLNLCINISDLLFDIYTTIINILHLLYGVEFTGFGCLIESTLIFALQVWIMNILVGISWVVRNDICYGKAVSQSAMLLYSVLSLAYCIVIAFISAWVGGYRQVAPGTCFVDISSVFAVVFFSLCSVTIPRIFMIYNLRITNKIIVAAQKELDDHGIQEQAKANYIRMVKKLNIFVIVTMTSFFPVTAAAIYEWITNQYIPPAFSIIVQINITLVSCIGNPTLFFYLNTELRRMFWVCVIWLLQYLKLLSLTKRLITSSSNKSKPSTNLLPVSFVDIRSSQLSWLRQHRLSDIESNKVDDRKYYYDIKNWMSDPDLFKAFKEAGKRDYALENFLFYEDARVYQTMGNAFLLRLKEAIRNSNSIQVDTKHLESDWENLEKCGLRIYNLYIKIPTSPLEINIPYDKKLTLINIFRVAGKTLGKISNSQTIVPLNLACDEQDSSKDRAFPSLRTLMEKGAVQTIADVEKYATLYDDGIQIILEILETDIWLRFIKSELFIEAMSEHRKTLDINTATSNKGANNTVLRKMNSIVKSVHVHRRSSDGEINPQESDLRDINK